MIPAGLSDFLQQTSQYQNPVSALSGGVNRYGPATPPPIQQPGNLQQILSGAGPYMQQALALAGQRPQGPRGPMPGPNQPPPPPAHIAPPGLPPGFQGMFPGGPPNFQISPIELQQQWIQAIGGGIPNLAGMM